MDVGSIADRYEQATGQGRAPHDDHDESVQRMQRTPDAIRDVSRVDVRRRCDVFGVRVPAADEVEIPREHLVDLALLGAFVWPIRVA
jgi:hypothetical protein